MRSCTRPRDHKSSTPNRLSLIPGTRIGAYEITAQIGVGGMGEVYRATDSNLKRSVAIKVLPASVPGDADRLARFQREAEVLAALNHPNIAAIYGLEKAPDFTALVMELVECDDLSQRIARGAIPRDEALPIAKQIAEALEAAHDQGIVHRDLKPANIKVRPDGTGKVAGLRVGQVHTTSHLRGVDGGDYDHEPSRGDGGRSDSGDASLYESRAGSRDVSRSGHRRLGFWMRALRAADRAASVWREYVLRHCGVSSNAIAGVAGASWLDPRSREEVAAALSAQGPQPSSLGHLDGPT